jgi:hypothetical protein
MPLSSLQHVTYAIADAMLAGPAEPAAMVERMTLELGASADWMNGLARRVAKRFSARWDSASGYTHLVAQGVVRGRTRLLSMT